MSDSDQSISQVANQPSMTDVINQIIIDLKADKLEQVLAQIKDFGPEELANLLEMLPAKLRYELWEQIPEEFDSEILPNVIADVRSMLIDEMEEEELVSAAGMMADADLALILDDLPEDKIEKILDSLDDDHRARVERVSNFTEDTAGRLMVTDVISIRKDVTLAVVLRWLRRHSELPPHTESLMVTDETGHYLGRLSISDLVTGDPKDLVEARMDHSADMVSVATTDAEVARLFELRDLGSLAVVDDDGILVGRITSDEVIDIIRAEADEQLLKPAGLSEDDDLFSPVFSSARRRAVWLGVNLVTVFLAAGVINQFEQVLQQIVALAILMPIVASMGGIAGSQTLALTLLGMSSERVVFSNVRWLMSKEIAVGFLNGIIWALVVGIVAYFWFGDMALGVIIAVAMMINLTTAAASGVIVPLTLKRLGMDPALSGAVVLTTVTDVVGFLSFLGLATIFLI